MTNRLRHKIIAEHIWRLLRAFFLLLGAILWLYQDGWTSSDYIIVGCFTVAHLIEQLHGYVCNLIERLFGWKCDFKNWE